MLLFYSSAISNRIEGTTLLFLIVKRYNSVIRLSHSKVNKKYKYKLVQSSPCINKKQNSLPPLQLTPEICDPPPPHPTSKYSFSYLQHHGPFFGMAILSFCLVS